VHSDRTLLEGCQCFVNCHDSDDGFGQFMWEVKKTADLNLYVYGVTWALSALAIIVAVLMTVPASTKF